MILTKYRRLIYTKYSTLSQVCVVMVDRLLVLFMLIQEYATEESQKYKVNVVVFSVLVTYPMLCCCLFSVTIVLKLCSVYKYR